MREKQFYLVLLMDFFSIFPCLYLASVFKTMGMQLGDIDDRFLTFVGSIGSVANGLSRVCWGSMQDRLGFRTNYRIVLITELFVFSLMPWIVQTNQYLYMVCVFMGYASLGAHFVLFPNVMVQIFGLKGGVQLCSFIYVTRCPSALSGLFISKALVTNFGEASYSIMCYTSCVFILISTLVLETIFKDKPIRKDVEPEKEICLPSINFE